MLRVTPVVQVGRQEGRNSPGSITFIQTGVLRTQPKEPLCGPGTTQKSIKSAQPTCSSPNLESQATREEQEAAAT